MTKKRTDRSADYISLPVNFADDIKIKPFIRQFGDKGLAFCIKMLSFIASQTGFEYEANSDSLEEVADYLDMTDKDFKELWNFALKKNLFQIVKIDGSDYFRSAYLEDKLLDQLLKKRNRNKRNMREARSSKPLKKNNGTTRIELDPQGNPIR